MICLKTSKRIWDKSSSKEKSENSFFVMNLLNSSVDLARDMREWEKILKLNFLSGKRGKQSGAFQTSFDYLQSAASLLQRNHWEEDYDFALKLLTTTAEIAYCIANYTTMDRIIVITINNVKCALHKIDCCSLQMRVFVIGECI